MSRRVAITKVEQADIERAVRDVVGLAGGFSELFSPSSRVLVKPNLCKAAPSGSGLVTDARVFEAVTKMVLEHNPASVVIAEGAMAGYDSGGFSTEDALEETGAIDVGRRLGVEVRNLNTDDSEEVKIPGAYAMDRVRLAKTVLQSDIIISVPVLKSHLRTNVTLSLKNMNGAMPGAEKRRSHRSGLDMAIADLNAVIRPHYAIIDAVVGMEGLWQIPQDSREMGLIVAGSNPLCVDVVGASLVGIDPKRVMHLQLLAKKDGVSAELESVEVVGEDVATHRQEFRNAFDVFRARFPQVEICLGEGACSGCTAELVSAVSYMDKAGFGEHMAGLTIFAGVPGEIPASSRFIVVGDCAKSVKGAMAYVLGCPPTDDNIIRGLCHACGVNEAGVLATMNEVRHKLWKASAAVLER